MNNIPDELFNKVLLYVSHPTSNLIKKEIKDIDNNIIKPLQKHFNIDFKNKSFYYKWRYTKIFKGNLKHMYHQFYYDYKNNIQ